MRPFMITAIAILATTACMAQTLEQPKAGSALRKAVMDGLRPTFEKDLKQKVIFKVDEIRVVGDWSFVHIHPLQPDSKPIDFSKTKYGEALREGMFDGDNSYALLKKVKGKWTVKEFAIGPTDVCWIDWMGKKHGAPNKVFPPLGG